MKRITRATDDAEAIRVHLANRNPLGEDEVAERVDLAAAREELERAISDEPPTAESTRPSAAWRRRPMATAATVAAVAVVAVAAPALWPFGEQGSPGAPASLAPQALAYSDQAYDSAEELVAALPEPGVPPPDRPVRYVQGEGIGLDQAVADGDTASRIVASHTEDWITPEAQRHTVRGHQAPTFPSSEDERRWREWFPPDEAEPSEHSTDLSARAEEMRELPAEPDALRDHLTEHYEIDESNQSRLVGILDQYLGSPVAPAELRRAAAEALAAVDGVDALGQTSDRLDRDIVALGFESDASGWHTRQEWHFDPHTGDRVGQEEVLLEDRSEFDLERGQVISGGWVLETAWVREVGDRPD
ncbi:hypothetical protein ER308_12095 [Egibacter rhizosphaerae]|uniref:CU044_5270 family protein n=1 Tax=Egibacter rhizosphaerae TaxID=1670831 RepID=A0A411YG36_9ACTN|nr:CU044_5270 family protein [Egibacter rhizosphaerae]QBI20234.1 hypothetical protein ER308_12095 [Egibacter rhizosphaerae]